MQLAMPGSCAFAPVVAVTARLPSTFGAGCVTGKSARGHVASRLAKTSLRVPPPIRIRLSPDEAAVAEARAASLGAPPLVQLGWALDVELKAIPRQGTDRCKRVHSMRLRLPARVVQAIDGRRGSLSREAWMRCVLLGDFVGPGEGASTLGSSASNGGTDGS